MLNLWDKSYRQHKFARNYICQKCNTSTIILFFFLDQTGTTLPQIHFKDKQNYSSSYILICSLIQGFTGKEEKILKRIVSPSCESRAKIFSDFFFSVKDTDNKNKKPSVSYLGVFLKKKKNLGFPILKIGALPFQIIWENEGI